MFEPLTFYGGDSATFKLTIEIVRKLSNCPWKVARGIAHDLNPYRCWEGLAIIDRKEIAGDLDS